MSNIEYVSVSALNKYINYKFEEDINLQEVYLKGEISNFKYSGKHCYFSIKDSFSEISAMFFYPSNLSLSFKPADGMSVQVVGKVQVYQKKGTYAIIVSRMAQAGIGLLYQAFLDLKDKLEKEGLFREDIKLKIPEYPEKVAVITAPTGEAIQDIVSTFNRRFPLAKIKLYPALVQGRDAPSDLVRALKLVYKDNDADAIIIGRGGGSFEDLSCFNDETLARTLFESKIPTISAVGHEGDYTICDFVASFRAPTPTGAAMKLTKDKDDIINLIIDYSKRLTGSIKSNLLQNFERYSRLKNSYGLANFDNILNIYNNKLENFTTKLSSFNPIELVKNKENILNETHVRLKNSFKVICDMKYSEFNQYDIRNKTILIENIIKHKITDLEKLTDKIVLLNPFNVMKKGYSIIYKNDEIISSATNLSANDEIVIKMVDGSVKAKVE